jgi:hypothetical protein
MTLRKIKVLLLLAISIACNNNRQSLINHVSKTQTRLFEILDSYEKDYANALNSDSKEAVRYGYSKILRTYLVDSLHRQIDSINVTVDSVLVDGLKVTNQFHTRSIEFKFALKFFDSLSPSMDALYNLMRNFKPGTEVTVNFDNIGGEEINAPGDKNLRTIRIFALPALPRSQAEQENR